MVDRRFRPIYSILIWFAIVAIMAPTAEAKKKTRRARPAPSKPAAAVTTEDWLARTQSAEARLHERWSVLVRDIDTSAVVFSYHPDLRLTPASNRKIATFAMALDLLGPDHKFRTEFGLKSPHAVGDPHYHGDVMLRSTGDPSLDNPFLNIHINPSELFREWAGKLRQEEGVVYVHGDLVIDATEFGTDQNAYPSVWDKRHQDTSYAVVPSALAVSQNLLSATVLPSRVGRAGRIELAPSGLGLKTVNRTMTMSSRRPGVSITFNEDFSELTLSGGVCVRDNAEVATMPMPRPLEVIGSIMRQALNDAGIRLVGNVRIVCNPGDAPGPMSKVIAVRESPTLNTILEPMMLHSNNFIAEQVWRAAAARVRHGAGIQAAREIELDYYKRHGLGWIQPGYDGCGLSDMDKTSANELVAIISTLYGSPYRDILIDCLPVAGESGTLRHRSYGRGEGRVIAKTGTLDGASALSGFVLDSDHRPKYVFSIIGNANGYTNGRLSERITELLNIVIRQLDNADRPKPKAPKSTQLARNQ